MPNHVEHPEVTPGHSRSGCGSLAGKLVGTVFFLVFFAVGSLFVVVLVREVTREAATYGWRATPATVISSGVERADDDDNPYRPTISYRYEFGGHTYIGMRVALRQAGTASYDDAQRSALRRPAGATITCFVDPDRPEQAVLERRNPLFALFLLLPLVFVVTGAGGLFLVWRRQKPELETIAISGKAAGQRRGLVVPIALGLVFVLVGGSLFIALGVVPAVRLLRAASWVEVPCTIVASTVRSHSSDDGTTYSIDILYEYTYRGTTLRSNRYDFASFSSSGYRSKRDIVDRYPAGAGATCYVNPHDPTWAVLNRAFRPSYLVGLFPLLFLVAGAGVASWGLGKRRQALRGDVTASHRRPRQASATGPTALEPTAGPAAKIAGSLIFALIWNGIVGVFLYQQVSNWMQGGRDWFLALFLVPFVLVGIGALAMVGYCVLAAFNPRPQVTLDRAALRLGSAVHVGWRFRGRAGRIQRLRIALEGREEATYRRGTDTHTDREVFARITIVDTTSEYEIPQGDRDVRIPEDTMHSFTGNSNRITWELKVSGEIARWPDVDEEFELDVRPLAPEELHR